MFACWICYFHHNRKCFNCFFSSNISCAACRQWVIWVIEICYCISFYCLLFDLFDYRSLMYIFSVFPFQWRSWKYKLIYIIYIEIKCQKSYLISIKMLIVLMHQINNNVQFWFLLFKITSLYIQMNFTFRHIHIST